MNALRTFAVLIFIITIMAVFPGIAIAGAPPQPGQWGVPTPIPSGGGGGGGSSYSAPTFQPFVMNLLSSNGSLIGTITGKNEYSIILAAGNNTSINGKNFTLSMYAEMGQKPSDDTRMDIDLLAPGGAGLPMGMNDITVLGVVNITRHGGSNWNLKLGTMKLTFSVPGTPGADSNATYYLVRFDGTNYVTQQITLKDSSNGMLNFEVAPSGESGLFTLVMAHMFSPTPTPTATPTPTPVPTSTPTPTPEPSIVTPTGIGILMAIFAVGAIAGASLIFIVFRK